jgi:hypothetical protein
LSVPRFLLDTNVISETGRPAPEPRVIDWLLDRPPSDLFLASVSLGELYRGLERLRDNVRRQKIERWIKVEILERYKGRILAFYREAATIWGRMLGAGERNGRPRPPVDAQITATALRYGLVLATRNTSDHKSRALSCSTHGRIDRS